MAALNPPLTKDDFLNVDWLDAIANSERKDCYFYQKAFWEKIYIAKAAGNAREQAVFEILATVTNVGIISESNKELFAQDFQRFTDEQLSFLAEIVSEVSDPELQARIADILWVRQRNHHMAQLAISAYLKSATEQQDPEDGYCFERIERAFRLACQPLPDRNCGCSY